MSVQTEPDGKQPPSRDESGIQRGAGLRFTLGPIGGFIEGRLNSIALDKGRSQFKGEDDPGDFGIVFLIVVVPQSFRTLIAYRLLESETVSLASIRRGA